ncbi:hypothetical protein [Halococcus hamelinensis]|uniref:Uncharacterized protein n=1 Tax=Halococcus hamelinensis 100A6 TaxID=1132509 RepID=M0LT06_9EURY|nr:hypothetical protein [Halococcus hamelinensis]EMA36697.1 hypothetical protein C447_13859 [Halococcus hamelinensis 100A6]
MKSRGVVWLVAVGITVFMLGGSIAGFPFVDESGTPSSDRSSETVVVTDFTPSEVHCGPGVQPGIRMLRMNAPTQHRSNYTIAGALPVRGPTAVLDEPRVKNGPTQFLVNITSPQAAYNPQNTSCAAFYRLEFTVPYAGTDPYSVLLLHNGRFVQQEYNSQFKNGTYVSGDLT